MAEILTAQDLRDIRPNLSNADADSRVRGAVARAALIAPCINNPDFEHQDAAKAIIMDALLRRVDAGTGSVTHEQRGPFSQSTDVRSTLNLFTSQERADLAGLCEAAQTPAHTIWTVPTGNEFNALGGAVINGPLGSGPGGL